MEKTKTDEEVEIQAHVTAELVNQIEFVKSGNDPYTYLYMAKAAVKVGNAVKEISLEYNRDYLSGEGYTPYECRLTPNSKQQFRDIEAAGIAINFKKILDLYDVMVGLAKIHQEDIKVEVEKLRIVDYKKRYKKCWAVGAKDLLYVDKNKTLIAKRDEVTITPCTEESFVKNERANATFEYRGFETNVQIYDKKFQWSGAYKGEKYQRINEGKPKRSIHLMTVLLKFIEAVDDSITTQEYVTKKNDKDSIERKEKAKLLEGFTGYPVTIMKKRQYSKYGNRRDSWYSYFYKLLTEESDKRDYESDYKGFSIDTKTDRKYVDDKYEEVLDSRTFSIDGMSNLSEKQFKGILALLLEDVKIITTKKKSDYIDN